MSLYLKFTLKLKLLIVVLFVNSITVYGESPYSQSQYRDTLKSDTSQIKAWIDLGKSHQNDDSALFYYHKAVDLAGNIGHNQSLALGLKSIGNIYFYQSQYDKAEEYWGKSNKTYEKIGDKSGMSATIGNLGIISEYTGDYPTALARFETAFRLSEELGDSVGIARNFGNIGLVYDYQGNSEKALEYLLQALTINEQQGQIGSAANNLNNIAIIYKNEAQYDKAIEYYHKALVNNKKIGKKSSIATNSVNIGIVYTQLELYDSALLYLNHALKVSEDISNQRIEASALMNMGIVYEYTERFAEALNYYKQAIVLNRSLNDKRGEAIGLINIASVMNMQEKYRSSLPYAFQGFKITNDINDLDLQRNSSRELYLAYQGIKDYQSALKYQLMWTTFRDSIYNIEKSKAIADLQIAYETEKKNKEIETLQKDNEIQKLQIEEQHLRSKAQQRLFLVIGLILFSIALVIWFLYHDYKKRQTIKQQKLRYQKIVSEQKLLRSQMNPHFIYNSLNSIQSFISSGNPYDAEKYLASFAKLIRGILENSRVEFVPLDKEIELMELYMQLEKKRFEDRFDFHIHINEDVENEFISIPPMLMQPYIENSIIHGFTNLKKGLLELSISEKDDFIICEIDDNGIGREQAQKLQESQSHNSLGTKITEERFAILYDFIKKKGTCEIIDKVDEKNQPMGTKVILKIPYIEN